MIFGPYCRQPIENFPVTRYVAKHLGDRRYRSVFKAALLGVPIPLCSCGVLPAASSLNKQGANKGATAVFLISTPESGVDSISVTYALLDPIMTITRPVSAFLSAMTAGIGINLFLSPKAPPPTLSTMLVKTTDCGCSNDFASTTTA